MTCSIHFDAERAEPAERAYLASVSEVPALLQYRGTGGTSVLRELPWFRRFRRM